ncbi:MAG: LptA/OstA family protein [Acetobacteraceae bacterium]
MALLLLLGSGMEPLYAQPLDLSQGGPITVTALGGIEWRRNQQEVVAHGDARATRGAVTITADRLIAHYRPKPPDAGGTPAASVQPASTSGGVDTGGQQIYRLNAEGNVHIFTATDQAFADHAVYDLDQSVLVLTGRHLKLTTPEDVLTAKKDVEYWPDKHMAVARGDAVVTTNTGRRVTADTLVAYTSPPTHTAASQGTSPAPASAGASDPLATAGQIRRVEAFGHVVLRTATETATGDRGVYIPATGIALLLGNVHITRGENQLNGERAVVDMKTGVADLLSAPGARVEGLVMPNSAEKPPEDNPGVTGSRHVAPPARQP